MEISVRESLKEKSRIYNPETLGNIVYTRHRTKTNKTIKHYTEN
jgi:hypothetical protein